jgi:cystathionine beta-lyase
MSKNPSDPQSTAKQTRLLRAGSGSALEAKTVSPPLQRGSTVLLPSAKALYDTSRPTYGRMGLSMQTALAEAVGELEGSGPARLFPSGLAAVTGTLLALLKSGDEILATDCVYGPSRRFCDGLLKRYGVATRYFAPDASPEAVMALAGPATRIILLESPGSLTFEIQDVPAIARLARERGLMTVIDNTWGVGLLYNPLSLGVDVSVQALTKYVGGHSDVFMGSACSLDAALLNRIDIFLRDFGVGVSPDDAYFMLRGLRTLEVRLQRHGENAMKVAEWLQTQVEVKRVRCPALPGAPGHDLWRRDFAGLNGLFSLVLRPGSEAAVEAFIDTLTLFGLGFSWGGFESLAIHCDPQLPYRSLKPAYGGPVIRLHVGLEDPGDLITDLRRGLDAYVQATTSASDRR